MADVKYRPMHNRVLVKRLAVKDRTASGLFVPTGAQERPQEGEVIAVGPGRLNEAGNLIPMNVKVGDIILFGKYAGDEIKIDEVEHILFREEDVLAVVEVE